MKKLLLASTALLVSAGVAAADVSVSGDGRMGVTYDNSRDTKWEFTNRIRVIFTLSGESDAGFSFGGSIQADNAADGADGTAGDVFISGIFGKISMGDVNSGDQRVVGQLHGVGLTGLGDGNEVSYEANGGGWSGLLDAPTGIPAFPTVREAFFPGYETVPARVLYEYEMAGFIFAASHSQTGSIRSYGVGIGYSMDGFSGGIGYGEARNNDPFALGITFAPIKATDITASAGYSMGDFEVKALYQDKKVRQLGAQIDRHKSLGISGAGSFDAVTVSAYAIRTRSRLFDINLNRAGIGMAYDLGGGASLQAGVARLEQFDLTTVSGKSRKTVADFGVALEF